MEKRPEVPQELVNGELKINRFSIIRATGNFRLQRQHTIISTTPADSESNNANPAVLNPSSAHKNQSHKRD